MTALMVLVVLAAVGVFGWACWRAGVERGLAECEDKLAMRERLHALAVAEAKREGRAQMGRETLGALDNHWRGNFLDLRSTPVVWHDASDVIDLRGES